MDSRKDFIRTFAGQHDLVAFADLPAKIEKGRVNICHAWEVMGIDRFIEQIRRVRLSQVR